jgi:hypothetical protein
MKLMSKRDQHCVLIDGLSIGCSILGVTALPLRTASLDRAFERAMREFPAAPLFRLVGQHGVYELFTRPAKNWPMKAHWREEGGWWRLDFAENVSAVVLAQTYEERYGVPAVAWKNFARSFVANLGNDKLKKGEWEIA